MKQETVIALHKSADFIRQLKSHLSETITIVEKKKIRAISQEIRTKPVSCIILHIEQTIPDEQYFEQFKTEFPYIPCVAVLVSQDMELARHCGSIGIDSVLLFNEMHCIEDEITRICSLKNNRITLSDISINKKNIKYSIMVKEALSIMEAQYIKIFNINEISDLMNIAEATLSREFAKCTLPGPKKILMCLKVQHAIKLMRNEGLNIREISSLSGFTDEKRMAECFHRMYGIPPGEYRVRNIVHQYRSN